MKKQEPPAPKPKTPSTVPHPARNLGSHLKKPTSGEIVTEHRWKGKKR